MKLLEYKQFNNSDEEKTLNKKKVIIAITLIVLTIVIGIIFIIYILNANFRNFMDKYILLKSVSENNLPYISIENEKKIYTSAYYNYVVVLDNNNLSLYNSSGKEVESFEINISSPIFATQDNYLVIAEKKQQKVYLIKDKKILWEKNVEGQISRVNVNQNVYVSVIVSGTSYKSVIATYSENGTEVFKTFLSSTLAVDVDISRDNKFLSFCEVDIAGTIIKSRVKTISIDKAKQDPQNSIIYTYEIPSDLLVTNIEYHERDQLLCICDKNIFSLKEGQINSLSEINQESITFSGINLSKSYFRIIEEVNGVNHQNSNIEIYNTNNKDTNLYIINGIAKEVYTQDGIIAVNLGTEIYFVGENGWLIKKYTSNQEIKDVVVTKNIAGIVFRDKIEFISL